MLDPRQTHHFRFRFAPAFAAASALVGVRPAKAWVTVTPERFVAHFGPWSLDTPLANVASARVTGPYFVPKVIGPPHLSFGDRGLTFGTNPDTGTCVSFHEPVPGIDPFGVLRHPALTVTVEDPEALAGLLDTYISAAAAVTGDEGEGIAAEALEPEAIHDDLEGLTASELRARVRDLGVPGASRMKKQELVDLLEGRARQAS
jgi:hypothetical protein